MGDICSRESSITRTSEISMFPGRDAFQGENGEECDVELELAEKHYCKYLLVAICKNIFSEGEYSR